MNRQKGYLILSNGRVFEGWRIGASRDTVGEIVFTTGMEGYTETLTDPSYAGQIITQTFPLVGNYGVCHNDYEGKSAAVGYIVHEICGAPSNFRCEEPVEEFLCQNGIPGLCGVDTRAVTKVIRGEGVMNAAISSDPDFDRTRIRNWAMKDAVASVSTGRKQVREAEGDVRFRTALIDYGSKENIIRCLQRRGCEVRVYPYDTPAEEILDGNPDGIVLSNGPGDPKENLYSIEQIRKLIGKVPMLGICLGHQLTALALGGETYKLKYGHRGANQPVTEKRSGRTYITSQNHGYAVLSDSLEGIGQEAWTNANDGSCEGMIYPEHRCFTVQFHPEASGGPRDTEFLFDRFLAMMGGEKLA